MNVTFENAKEISTLALWDLVRVVVNPGVGVVITEDMRLEAAAALFALMARATERDVIEKYLLEERALRRAEVTNG